MFAIGLAEAYRVSVGWAQPTSEGFNKLKEDYEPGTPCPQCLHGKIANNQLCNNVWTLSPAHLGSSKAPLCFGCLCIIDVLLTCLMQA